MILLIDNYDSFTYNLVQYIRQIGEEVIVYRNDEITLTDVQNLQPDYIMLSPGPGNPDDAGICLDLVKTFHTTFPIIGVCLGHQIIAQAFGASIIKAKEPKHGKISSITHDKIGLFHQLDTPIQVTRYHSLVIDESSLPPCLEVSAKSEDGEVMAIRHKNYPIEGVQFHPEAILTEYGLQMIKNFVIESKRIKEEI